MTAMSDQLGKTRTANVFGISKRIRKKKEQNVLEYTDIKEDTA